MTEIQTLFPDKIRISVDQFSARLREIRNSMNVPFNKDAVAFCRALSKKLLNSLESREYPQLVALGYWLRDSKIKHLQESYSRGFFDTKDRRVPRGIAFHIPPTNVDTIFVYSWVLSLLAGNANLIRLPNVMGNPTELLVSILHEVATPWLRGNSLFVSYPIDSDYTAIASQNCAVRIIWGGDQKIFAIQRTPMPTTSVELKFGNRHSLALIRAAAYEDLSYNDRDFLAERFSNDIYWFDQMGCASPRIVFWESGAEDFAELSGDFYERIHVAAKAKNYTATMSVASSKLKHAYWSLAEIEGASYRFFGNLLTVISVPKPSDYPREPHGGGFLFESRLGTLEELIPVLADTDQTLIYFGYSKEELSMLLGAIRGRAVDRVVPMGQALQFHHVWDGIDLFSEFTRSVQIE